MNSRIKKNILKISLVIIFIVNAHCFANETKFFRAKGKKVVDVLLESYPSEQEVYNKYFATPIEEIYELKGLFKSYDEYLTIAASPMSAMLRQNEMAGFYIVFKCDGDVHLKNEQEYAMGNRGDLEGIAELRKMLYPEFSEVLDGEDALVLKYFKELDVWEYEERDLIVNEEHNIYFFRVGFIAN